MSHFSNQISKDFWHTVNWEIKQRIICRDLFSSLSPVEKKNRVHRVDGKDASKFGR